eukprot:UN11004
MNKYNLDHEFREAIETVMHDKDIDLVGDKIHLPQQRKHVSDDHKKYYNNDRIVQKLKSTWQEIIDCLKK